MNCVQCNEPAFVRCRKHRQFLCGSSECVDKHRGVHSVGALDAVIPAAWGDCEFVEAGRYWEPMDWVVAIGAAVVLVVGVAVVVVHL